MSSIQQLPECDRCLFNARSSDLICSIHPKGVESDRCIDYRCDPNLENWAPTGYAWYAGELITSTDSLTDRDRLNLLDTHPLFTGR